MGSTGRPFRLRLAQFEPERLEVGQQTGGKGRKGRRREGDGRAAGGAQQRARRVVIFLLRGQTMFVSSISWPDVIRQKKHPRDF